MTTNTKFLTVQEFLEALGGRISRNSVYKAINTGQIPCCFIGRRRLIPENALSMMLEPRDGETEK